MRVIDREQAILVGGFHSGYASKRAHSAALARGGTAPPLLSGSGGGRKAIYALTRKASLLIGAPHRGPRRAQGEILAADNFVSHQLTVNNLYCCSRTGPFRFPM